MKEKQKPGGDAIPWRQRFAAGVCKWFCALSAPEKWGVGILASLAAVFAIFGFCNLTAEWVGYSMTMGDNLTPGARFFRDVVVALAAIIGIGTALWRTAAFDRQTKVSENRLLSERFATAAELMAKETKNGNPAISARISGIYIMEKLAISTPKEFAEQVVKNLIAYIKGHAQLTAVLPTEGGEKIFGGKHLGRMLGEDVKTSFAVLHNILSNAEIKAIIDSAILDFSNQDFSGLNLMSSQVNLGHYKNWIGTNFKFSLLCGADFKDAYLSFTKLEGTHLEKADLRGAKYDKKELANAHTSEAKMDDN